MRRIGFAVLIVLLACFLAQAQHSPKPAIHGQGTPGTLPQFTGSTEIGNSIITQSGTAVSVSGNFDATINSAPGLALFGRNNTSEGSTDPGVSGNADIVGVQGDGFSPAGVGVVGRIYAEVGDPIGVLGKVRSADRGTAVRGSCENDKGLCVGVVGETGGPDGVGVVGANYAASGDPIGVLGYTFSSDRGIGVRGQAVLETGGGIGVLGEAVSPDGTAGVFNNFGGGTILLGSSTLAGEAGYRFRVDGTGKVFANGGFQAGGADFAESMQVKGDRRHYEPGDLLVIDRGANRRLTLADTAYSSLVAGIYSSKPGVVASPYTMDDPNLAKEVPMAVVGIVLCKVSAENGAIEVGDLLVASSTPGHAMKGTDRSKMLGAVVGKALEPLHEGKGLVQVLVTLQ